MLRASALALLLMTAPALAARPSPFWFEQMAQENGTPDTHGADEDDDSDDVCVVADEGSCPDWVIVGYDYNDEGALEPVYYDNRNGPHIVPEGFTDVPVLPETPLSEIPYVEGNDSPEDDGPDDSSED